MIRLANIYKIWNTWTDAYKKDLFWLTINQLLFLITPLVTYPILSKQLGVAGLGIIFFCQSFALFFIMIIENGFYLTSQREVAKQKKNISKVKYLFNITFFSKILIITLLTPIFFFISSFLSILNDKLTLVVILWIYVIGVSISFTWFLRGMGLGYISSIIESIGKIFIIFLIFILIKKPGDEYLFFVIFSAVSYLSVFSMFLFSRKYVTIYLIGIKKITSYIKINLSLFTSHLLGNFLQSGNIILLGIFTSQTNVALYGAAEKVVRLSSLFIMPFVHAAFPVINEKLNNDRENAIIKINNLSLLLIPGSALLTIIIFFSSELIINFLFGTNFEKSILLLKIMSPLPIFFTLNIIFGFLWVIPNKFDRKVLKILLIANLFNISFIMSTYYLLGLNAPSISIVICELLIGSYFLYIYQTKKIKV